MATLTANEKKILDGGGSVPNLGTKLEGLVIAGTATIGANTSFKTGIAIGAEYDGKPAIAMVMSADGTLTHILRVEWDGSGNLSIYGNANATADVTVAYAVFGTE